MDNKPTPKTNHMVRGQNTRRLLPQNQPQKMEFLNDLKNNGPYLTGFMLCAAAAFMLLREGYIAGVLFLTFPALYTMIFEDRTTPPTAEKNKPRKRRIEDDCLGRNTKLSTYEELCVKIQNDFN